MPAVSSNSSNHAPLSSKVKSSPAGLGCLLCFFSIFAFAGAALFYAFTVRPILRVIEAQSWPSVSCQITDSRVTTAHDSDGTTYAAEFSYSYSFKGQEYSSSRYSFGNKTSSGWRTKVQSQANAYPVGMTTQCFVNPQAPSEAVLNRGFTPVMLTGCFGLLFLAVGLGIPFGMWRSGRRLQTLTTGNHSEFWQPQPSAILSTTPGGGVQVKASSGSPLSRTIGAWFVCLFWNGITGGVTWGMLHERSSGVFKLFPLLFLIPFVLIGLVIFCFALNQTLTLFNPRPLLTFPYERMRPGDSIEIAWQLRGGVSRPQSVTLALEGHEEVKFSRGTDTITQKQLFFSMPLYHSPPGAVPATDKCRIEIPSDAMHSLEAPHNTIRWTISFKAKQQFFPDIQEEWKLIVDPRT